MVYITGDIHGGIDMHKLSRKVLLSKGIELTENDFLIILGDFGLPFLDSEADETHGEYTYWIKWLSKKTCTILWIDGNHDNFNFWERQRVSEWHGGRVQVHPRAKNVIHLMRGEIYEIEGEKYFAFGGAVSHDKEYRKSGYDMWEQEQASESDIENARRNLERFGYKVDYILSHTPPSHIIDSIPYIERVNDRGTDFLSQAALKTEYRLIARLGRFSERIDAPVIIGEHGSQHKDNEAYRAAHAAYFTSSAAKTGIKCFWWDTQGSFGLLDRANSRMMYESIVKAITFN